MIMAAQWPPPVNLRRPLNATKILSQITMSQRDGGKASTHLLQQQRFQVDLQRKDGRRGCKEEAHEFRPSRDFATTVESAEAVAVLPAKPRLVDTSPRTDTVHSSPSNELVCTSTPGGWVGNANEQQNWSQPGSKNLRRPTDGTEYGL